MQIQINMKEYNLESFKDKDLYTWEEIISKIEDLECEIKMKEEELEDFQNDVESNYRRLSDWEQSGMSVRDFI